MNANPLLLFVCATVLPSLLIAWISGFVVRRFAPLLRLVDQPGHRKVHATPTPLGGGVAIWFGVVFSFLCVSVALLLIQSSDNPPATPGWFSESISAFTQHIPGARSSLDSLWLIVGAATVLMVVGLTDDFRNLGWKIRIGIQVLVAVICVYWQGMRLTGFINIESLTGALSVLWIVAMINSFNMLDNMDGLSGGVAAIAASILAAVMLMTPEPDGGAPQYFVAGFLLVVVGGVTGFLFHNRPPARLFMGDAGSYFVGFSIAVATLLATYTGYRSEHPLAVFAPVCVMAVPMYDMVTVLWIRIREGRSLFQADKRHFSHRLVDLGLTKGQAVLTIYLLTATCGLGALLLNRVDAVGATIVILMIVCILALIAILETTARRKINGD